MLANRLSTGRGEGERGHGAGGESRGVLLAAIVMAIVGWGGLAHLVVNTRPRIGGEIWLFFIFLQIAVTGSAIPVMRLASLRLARAQAGAPQTGVIVRRSVWIGIIAVTCAWLLIPRYLTLPILLILALLFLVIEIFLRNRELADER
ncbi:MAG: hypothetical protein OXI30_02025 [Chloroflexota bacterium]|nr:hypothetical protein [Chloroflexota bacterium]